MANVLFVDFETTSLDRDTAKPVQVAAMLVAYPEPREENQQVQKVEFSSLLDPGAVIEPEAMAVHRIEQEEVVGKPTLTECQGFLDLFDYADYVVAHNGKDFDFPILLREGGEKVRRFMSAGAWMDTLRMSRRQWPEFPEHKLASLMYRLVLIPKATRKTFDFHNAVADVEVCRLLFERIWWDRKLDSVEELWEFDGGVDPAVIMPFGKYQGQLIADLKRDDPRYLEWCLSQSWLVGEWPGVLLGIVRECTPEQLDETKVAVERVLRTIT